MRLSLKSSVKERAGFVVLATLIGSLVWLGHSSASDSAGSSPIEPAAFSNTAPQKRKKDKKPPPCTHCAPAGNQEIYIPLIDLPEAQGSEIVFNSRSPQAMDVTPVFYKRNGETVIADPVRIESAEIRYVNVMDLLPERYRHEGWGGFALTYYGFNREMWSQFRFIGVNGGSNVDEFFTVKDEAHSDTYQAAWWIPEKSEAILALGNITDTATSASVAFGSGRTQTVNLPPHATELVRDEHSRLEGAESVVVNVTGTPGSVIPTGIITSKDGSFNSVIRFYDPTKARQSNLYANGFRVTGNTPHMVLKNTTSSSIAVAPKFVPLSGEAGGPFTLSQVVLAPNGEAEVDLKPLMRASRRRHDLDVVSVEIPNYAGPGSIIGSLYGINDTAGTNYDIPLRDSGLVRTMTGSYPWKIADDFTTIAYITNISDQQAEFIGQINFDGGHFVIDPRKLAPGETAVFDFEKIRHDQEADNAGTRLPLTASLGQFKWAIHGVTNGKLLLIGRAEMVSRSKHISTSYSCNDPCPPYLIGWLDGLDTPIIINGTTSTSAWQTANYDSGYNMGPYSVPADWSIDSSAISINPYSAHTTTVTGEDPGNGCVTGDMGWQERYSWDGQNCYDNNFADPIGDTDCTEVAVSIRRLQYQTGSNHDIGAETLYVLKGTTVTFNALPDPPGATFPSGQPTWGGSSGISGTGQTKSVTFDTTSSNATDFKTVTATAQNSLTANVIVIELTGHLIPDDNFSGRSATNFGIHERITLSLGITPSGITPAQVGGIQWQQGSGDGTLIDAPSDGTGSYRVADSAGSATLVPAMAAGPSQGSGPANGITVVAPSGAEEHKFSGIRHFANWWSCGYKGDIFVSPKNVSFLGLYFKEEDVGSTADGWLSFLNNLSHSPGPPLFIGSGNINTGARIYSDGDEVFSGKYRSLEHGAYATGTLNWAIPWDYSITGTGGTWILLATINQTADSTSTGKCTITKGGSGVVVELTADDSEW